MISSRVAPLSLHVSTKFYTFIDWESLNLEESNIAAQAQNKESGKNGIKSYFVKYYLTYRVSIIEKARN